jgi:hypothetical protein
MPLIPRPFPLFTLRTALLWLVFLPSLLVAAGAVGAGWAVLGQIDGADKAASLKIARGLAAQVEDRLHEAESTVRQLAAALEASPPDRRSEVFTRLSAVAAPFEEIELLDPGLVVRASWPDDAALTGADYSALEPLRRLANESSAAWTDSSVSPRTGRTTASLALPFEGGILWASLDLGRLSALVLQLSDETASVDLVDSRGRYLAHSDPNLVGQPVNEHERLDRLDAGTTSGAVRVASFALPQSGWAVLVTLVREPGQRGLTAAWWFLPVAAALVLAGWGLGLWLNRRLRAGIESLVKQTEGIRRGDLSEALPGRASATGTSCWIPSTPCARACAPESKTSESASHGTGACSTTRRWESFTPPMMAGCSTSTRPWRRSWATPIPRRPWRDSERQRSACTCGLKNGRPS